MRGERFQNQSSEPFLSTLSSFLFVCPGRREGVTNVSRWPQRALEGEAGGLRVVKF